MRNIPDTNDPSELEETIGEDDEVFRPDRYRVQASFGLALMALGIGLGIGLAVTLTRKRL